MNKAEMLKVSRMRHNAQTTGQNYHVYPTAEEKLHTLEVTQATTEANAACLVTQAGLLCFCEPGIENYTDQGGGLLIIHRSVKWQ